MTSSLGIKLCSVFVFILHSFFATGTGAFSVNYYSHNGHGAVIGSMLVHSTPSALQVADIYSRLSGLQPLLNEGVCVCVPSLT